MEAKLSELDIRCSLDTGDLLPGEETLPAIGRAMAASRTVLVFFGPSGTPPWSDQSSLSILESYAKQPETRVIPVMLPGASHEDLALPTFLGNILAVEVRSLRDQEAISRIARAVLATRPDSTAASPQPTARRSTQSWIGPASAFAVILLAALTAYFGFLRNSGSNSTATLPSPSLKGETAQTLPNPGRKTSDGPVAPEWGVMVSADRTLEPAPGSDGGPSAEWEPVRAWRAGYTHAVIFHRGTYYWTVITDSDQASAEATMQKIRINPLYKSWANATVLEVKGWCPDARFQKTLQVAASKGQVTLHCIYTRTPAPGYRASWREIFEDATYSTLEKQFSDLPVTSFFEKFHSRLTHEL